MPLCVVTASRTAVSVRSVEEIVNLTDEPKIFKLQKTGGGMNVAMIIEVMLSKMADDMHIKDGLTESNINEIVKRLTTDDEVRYWLTLADVSLLCRRIAEGYYGKTYGRFGLGEFNECLIKYCNERNEVHRLMADKYASPDAEVLNEVGYSMDKHGNLVVPEEKKGGGKRKPLRYLYDEKGEIKGENPAYWAKYIRKDDKTPKEMEKINKHNKVMELVHELMKADPSIGYINAVEMAVNEIENEK